MGWDNKVKLKLCIFSGQSQHPTELRSHAVQPPEQECSFCAESICKQDTMIPEMIGSSHRKKA